MQQCPEMGVDGNKAEGVHCTGRHTGSSLYVSKNRGSGPQPVDSEFGRNPEDKIGSQVCSARLSECAGCSSSTKRWWATEGLNRRGQQCLMLWPFCTTSVYQVGGCLRYSQRNPVRGARHIQRWETGTTCIGLTWQSYREPRARRVYVVAWKARRSPSDNGGS